MDQRLERLLDFFQGRAAVAVAYSGGVDSSLTLWAAAKALGGRALGVTIRSEFICALERQRAGRIGRVLEREAGARIVQREVGVLCNATLRANPADRCYLCKQLVMDEVRAAALEHLGPGADLAEGTNADDDPARPGRRAVAEAGALSPLAACGLAKKDVRELARLVDLPNADDPSNSCLATRVPTDHELTYKRLTAVEGMERAALDLGLVDMRARLVPRNGRGDAVRLLVRPAQMLFAQGQLPRLLERASFIGFCELTLGERQ